jgi:hypothetical protein
MIFYNYYQVRTFIILLCGFYLMLLPTLLHAQVVINEIMYDPEGSDTGREWIEVYNAGTIDVDLATYKLLESNVNHKLTLTDVAGNSNSTSSSILKSNSFAIVADNPQKFLLDFPEYVGLLFDSAFSLNNTGEPLAIVNGSGAAIDNFEYSGDLGAGNNGNSLQLNNTGFWIEAGPTVGSVNKNETESGNSATNSGSSATSSTSNSGNNNSSTHSSQAEITKYLEKSGLEIGAGRNRFAGLRSPIEFKAEYNTDKKPRFMWNWGDGSFNLGHKTDHTYKNSGVYNVVLNAFLNGYQATARVKATISEIYVDILSINSGKLVDIMLKNMSEKEVNLGGFIIKTASTSKSFEIPRDTIIDAKSTIIIPGEYTDFETSTTSQPAELYYPDGILLDIEELLIPTSTSSQMI